MAQCPACNQTNPSSARFCQSCGKKLAQVCRHCRAENSLQAQFCGSCGVNLANAKFGISDKKASEWWEYFSSFGEFKQMTTGNGWVRNKFYPYTRNLLSASTLECKSLLEEKMALYLPITNRDWCIVLVKYDTVDIKYGALWAGTSGFAIFDFDKHLVYFLLYELLNSCTQNGDNITLTTIPGNTISMAIRPARPSEAANIVGFGFDLLSIFANTVSKDSVAQLNQDIRFEREMEVRRNQIGVANAYVEGIAEFFSKIIKIRKDFDKA